MAAQPADPELQALMKAAEAHGAFGPLFFLTQLAGFVRDQCPDVVERLPIVELRLHSAESLRICHVIGVGPQYVALAVYDEDDANAAAGMRTELLPYEAIARVTVRTTLPTGPQIGFRLSPSPAIMRHGSAMTPEEALHLAATAPNARSRVGGQP